MELKRIRPSNSTSNNSTHLYSVVHLPHQPSEALLLLPHRPQPGNRLTIDAESKSPASERPTSQADSSKSSDTPSTARRLRLSEDLGYRDKIVSSIESRFGVKESEVWYGPSLQDLAFHNSHSLAVPRLTDCCNQGTSNFDFLTSPYHIDSQIQTRSAQQKSRPSSPSTS